MAKYDVPANIDYIINETNVSKVAYVGHSQGTTQMFAALADNEDQYVDKVSAFVALGPVTKIRNTGDFSLKYISDNYDMIDEVAKTFGIHTIGSNPGFWSTEA